MSTRRQRPGVILLDLLMATMDAMDVWIRAAGDEASGVAWRDATSARMVDVGRYVPYEGLAASAAAELGLPTDATARLRGLWPQMRPRPDAVVLGVLGMPYAFVTNCSRELAAIAVSASGLRPAFTLSAEEAGWYKPRPEIYAAACRRARTSPAGVRYVAGAAYDAVGAASAGLDTALVLRRPLTQGLPGGIRTATRLGDALFR